jgi:hypothetical protein
MPAAWPPLPPEPASRQRWEFRWAAMTGLSTPGPAGSALNTAGWLTRGVFRPAAASEVSIDAGEVEHLSDPALAGHDLEYLAHGE